MTILVIILIGVSFLIGYLRGAWVASGTIAKTNAEITIDAIRNSGLSVEDQNKVIETIFQAMKGNNPQKDKEN